MNSSTSAWFEDPDTLLQAMRHDRAARDRRPTLPGYDDFAEVARGGQGIVYRATQQNTRRTVAVKVLLDHDSASPAAARRFRREIELVAGLRHPSIVRVYDSGKTTDGRLFLVMDFIEGLGLDEFLRFHADGSQGTKWAVREAVGMFATISDAITYAHQRGAIHRDIKPSNIRLDRAKQPHVLDFGLAKFVSEDAPPAETVTRSSARFIGSLPWASPEQVGGSPHDLDVRSDVYSLGVLLYQMVTGAFPYDVSGGLHDVARNITQAQPLRPSQLRRGIDDELDTIILTCLAKQPQRRYQSAAALADDVRRYLADEPIAAKRDSAWYTLRKRMQRYRTAVRFSTALVVVALASAAVMGTLWSRAAAAEKLAAARWQTAEDARAAEAVARGEALREKEQAQIINTFLLKMFAEPVETGREARVTDLLAVARADLARIKDPATLDKLKDTLGVAYSSMGQYAEARALLSEALAGQNQRLGPEDATTLDTRSHLAWLSRLEGRLEESEAEYRAVLDVRGKVFGDEHVDTLRMVNDLAVVVSARGRPTEAAALYESVMPAMAAALGEDSIEYSRTLGNLADVYHELGRLDEALALMRRRLEACKQHVGEFHVDTGVALNNLAILLGDLGQYEESVAMMRRVVEIRRRIFGEDHPDYCAAEANLGSKLHAAGQLQEAEDTLRQAVAHSQRFLGPEHANTLSAMSNLALVIQDLGKLDEAEQLHRQVLEIRRRVLGEDHRDTVNVRNNLGTLLAEQHKSAEAEQVFRDVVASCRRALGDEAPVTLTAMQNLTFVMLDQHKTEGVKALVDTIIENRSKVLGADHAETLVSEKMLADYYLEAGEPQKACEVMESLLPRLAKALPPDHWYIPVFQGTYGRCLLEANRLSEAETVLNESARELSTRLGETHWRVKVVLERLRDVYTKAGNEPAAEATRLRLEQGWGKDGK